MTQTENLHRLFQEHDNKLTLGQILERWDMVGSKYTNRISELRELLKLTGFDIFCHMNRKRPTDTLYEILPVKQFRFEEGQGVLL